MLSKYYQLCISATRSKNQIKFKGEFPLSYSSKAILLYRTIISYYIEQSISSLILQAKFLIAFPLLTSLYKHMNKNLLLQFSKDANKHPYVFSSHS